MNNLYKLPLHGIACRPFCSVENNQVLHNLNFTFAPFNEDDFNHLQTTIPDWTMKDEGTRYKTKINIFIQQETYRLTINCQGTGQFIINKNNISVSWSEIGTDSSHYFQTLCSALWLELNNTLCIHANALSYKNEAIAFVAPSRTGKTTLTAELCKQDFSAMTDDMMALHEDGDNYQVYPSWPVARMWPETLDILGNSFSENLEKVHQNFAKKTVNLKKNGTFEFCEQPKKLKTIYVLKRIEQNSDRNYEQSSNQSSELSEVKTTDNQAQCSKICTITKLPVSESVIILIQNSILGSAYKALSIENRRLINISALVSRIQVKQITYQSGKQHFSAIREAIVQDLTD